MFTQRSSRLNPPQLGSPPRAAGHAAAGRRPALGGRLGRAAGGQRRRGRWSRPCEFPLLSRHACRVRVSRIGWRGSTV